MKHIVYLGLGRWPNGPGDPRIFQKQLPAAVRAGFRVTALVTGTGEPYDLHGVRIVPRPWFGGLLGRMRHLSALYREARALQADVYWFGNYEVIFPAVMLKRATGARLVYDAMEHWPDMVRQSPFLPPAARPLLAGVVAGLEWPLVPAVDLMMTADEPTMERYRRHPNRMVVFNFPSLSTFDAADPARVGELRARYAGRRLLVYVGSMGFDRGLREMVHAVPELRRRHPDVLLLLIGEFTVPAWLEEVRETIARLDVAEAVDLVGAVPQDDLPAYLGVAEAGIAFLHDSPKHQKNIATKQFDYMACRIPTVATDLAPMRDFLGAAGAGLLVPAHGHEALAGALCALLEDPDRARAMGRAGRAAVEARWNWEVEEAALTERLRGLFPTETAPGSRAAAGAHV